eukprot:646531-Prorocentrum_minimum.AAC.2
MGGWYSYRAAKTALNQLTKCAAVEFSRKKHPVTCVLLHPGTVATDLSLPFQKGGAHPQSNQTCNLIKHAI